jgi:hypothetical protein
MKSQLLPQPAGAWDVRVASSPDPADMLAAPYRWFSPFFNNIHFSSIS